MKKYRVTCHSPQEKSFTLVETSKSSPGNFESDFHSTFSDQLHSSLARDLVSIGEGIFLCDRSFKRGKKLGNKTRDLVVEIPVENRHRWNEVKWKVEAWAKFVSHDVWTINFKDYKSSSKSQAISPKDNLPKNTVVCLFSDGLDSLCGALLVMRQQHTPIFVSHTPPGFKTAQNTIDALKKRFNLSHTPSHNAAFRFMTKDSDLKTGKRNMMPEHTRRTRPVLYLSLAGAVALETDSKIIRINENGFMSVNLPTAFQKSGSDISRHAHPEMLRMFEDILSSVLPENKKIKVENPFEHLTKGEQVAELSGADDLVSATMSCAYGRRQMARVRSRQSTGSKKAVKECGLCIPCLIRRAAITKAKIQENSNHYAYSIEDSRKARAKKPLLKTIRGNVDELTSYSKKIMQMSKRDFVTNYLYELSLVADDPNTIGLIASDAYKLNKRFANEFLDFIHKSR